MKDFRKFVESKGIRLNDEMHDTIMKAVPQIAEVARRVKETGQAEDLPLIAYRRKYELAPSGNPKRAGVTVRVLNNQEHKFEGQFEWGTVRFNVAHVKQEGITDDWVYHILVHELGIHGVDPKLSNPDLIEKLPEKPQLPADATPEQKSAYFGQYVMQPQELDAFSGEIVNFILRDVPKRFPPDQAAGMLDELMTWMKQPTDQPPAILRTVPRWLKAYQAARKFPRELFVRFTSRVANAALESKTKLAQG